MAIVAGPRPLPGITFLVGIVVAARHLTPMPVPVRSFVQLIVLWYTLAIFYVILRRWVPQARWHAPLQMACDLLLVTGVVYSTGMQDSYFVSLYLLAILMASVLFSRRGVFLVAGFASCSWAERSSSSSYGVIPRTASSMPTLRVLDSWLASNLFAFFAVAYLGSLLAQTLRKKGVELEAKSEELKDLQTFNQDIIESMRGGLLTTDMEGRILVMNRAGAEITGSGFGLHRGEKIADIFPGFWPVERDEQGNPLAARKEIEYQDRRRRLPLSRPFHLAAAHRAKPEHGLRLSISRTSPNSSAWNRKSSPPNAWPRSGASPPPSLTKFASR